MHRYGPVIGYSLRWEHSADYEELVQCIVSAARRLERAGVSQDRFRIQFIQIGLDGAAAEALRVLDDDLAVTYKIMVRRRTPGLSGMICSASLQDIVDTIPFNHAHGVFDTEYMLRNLYVVKSKVTINTASSALLSPLRTGSPLRSPRGLTATLGSRMKSMSSAASSPGRAYKTLPRY